MRLFSWLLTLAGVTPEEGVATVDAASRTLERGGLYVVVVVLLFGLIVIFVIKERQLQRHEAEKNKQIEDRDKQVKDLHTVIISMVERHTAVQTEVALTMKKLETYLERLLSRLSRGDHE